MSKATVVQEDLKGNVKNEMMIFDNPEFGKVRSVMINNEPWFVGKDVATILGYSNPQKALRDHVDEEDRTVNESFTVNGTMGVLINESGLYSLILSSKLPKAKEFKRWVTSEILPSIRKHGLYATEELEDKILNNPDFLIKVLTELKEERKQKELLTKKTEEQEKEISELKPKAEITDILTDYGEAISINQFAAVLFEENNIRTSQNKLFRYLEEKGILCTADHVYHKPMQEVLDKGYMVYKEYYNRKYNPKSGKHYYEIKYTPRITSKGQTWLTRKILSDIQNNRYEMYFK